MKILVLIFSLLVVNCVSSQNKYIRYHAFSNQACKALENGDAMNAFIMLTEAFRLVDEPKSADLLNMAKCYSFLNDSDAAESYLLKAIKQNQKIGQIVRIHVLWFKELLGEASWNRIVELTHQKTEIPEHVEKINEQINFYDSIAHSNYFKYLGMFGRENQLIPGVRKQIEDSVYVEIKDHFPSLDSLLLSLPDSLLKHPSLAERFFYITFFFPQQYFEERVEMFEELIDRGFSSPDLLGQVYVKREFGEDANFSFWTYSGNDAAFYNKYGLVYDYKMNRFRNLQLWEYDD